MSYVVKYQVTGQGSKWFETEPYESHAEAETHLADIAGFEGVHSAYVTTAGSSSSSKKGRRS